MVHGCDVHIADICPSGSLQDRLFAVYIKEAPLSGPGTHQRCLANIARSKAGSGTGRTAFVKGNSKHHHISIDFFDVVYVGGAQECSNAAEFLIMSKGARCLYLCRIAFVHVSPPQASAG